MLYVLVALLAVNTVLHALIVVRFGTGNNLPVLVFTVIYAALTLAVLLAVPYALWATLILSIIGFVALTVSYRGIARDKTIDGVIWVVDAVTILYVAYLLFLA